MSEIREIFIHCTATRPDWMPNAGADAQVAEIDKWHKARGWNGFGYNWLISRNGSIGRGRPEGAQTAAAVGHNTGAIHIVLVGGHGSDAHDRFDDHFTKAQRATLLTMLRRLKQEHPRAVIRGHNEVAAKACPGFQVAQFLAENPLEQDAGAAGQAARPGLAAIIARLVARIFGGRA